MTKKEEFELITLEKLKAIRERFDFANSQIKEVAEKFDSMEMSQENVGLLVNHLLGILPTMARTTASDGYMLMKAVEELLSDNVKQLEVMHDLAKSDGKDFSDLQNRAIVVLSDILGDPVRK